MDPTTQVITTVGSTLAIFGAFAAWLIRYMDRRFEEIEADTRRQFAEAREDSQRQFAESRDNLTECMAGVQRQFSEAKEDTQRGFDEMRKDYHRLEGKLDAHGEQIANLRQDVGRLQGVVERSFQPDRFTVAAGREAAAGEEVR